MEVLGGDGGDRRGRSRRERVAEKMAGTGNLKRVEEALIGHGVGASVGQRSMSNLLV